MPHPLINEAVTAIGANGPDAGNLSGYASLEEVEKRHIVDVLRQTEWIKVHVAPPKFLLSIPILSEAA